jgi:succinoglycan biosynthesis transport protein ExoP
MADQSLHDYVNALRRRRWVVISSVLLAIGAASAVSLLQTPQYRAESQLLLRRTSSQEVLIGDAGQARSSSDSERELNNEIRLVESQAVRDAVDLVYDGPLDVDDVDGSAPESQTNDVLEVSLVSSDPAAATELVNVYVETYINERRSRSLDNLRAASDEIQARLDDLRARIDELSRPLSAIDAQIAAAPVNSARRAELEEQRQTISSQVQPQLTPLQSRESAFRGQLEQLEAAQNLSTPGGVEVLTPAEEPESPVSPNTVSNLVVGGLIGLLAGIALALMRDYLDDTVRSKDQAEDVTQVPTLGLIPKGLKGSPASDLISVTEPTSPATEAYRSLRTSVKFLSLDASVKTILVTSAAASEGKTVTAANLAVVLAQRGDSVILVDADLRRPRAHRLFGAPQSPGLTSVLLDDASATSAVYPFEEVPGLHVMPPGSPPPNPAELLDSSRTRDLLAKIADEYDSVIIDAPPVLSVTDAQILACMADGVLLVVAYRETSRRNLTRSIELLGQVEAPLVGTVLNLVPASEAYAGQSYPEDAYRSRGARRRRRVHRGDDTHPSVHLADVCGNGDTTTPVADRATSPLSPGEGARPDMGVPHHPRSAISKATPPKPRDSGVTGS